MAKTDSLPHFMTALLKANHIIMVCCPRTDEWTSYLDEVLNFEGIEDVADIDILEFYRFWITTTEKYRAFVRYVDEFEPDDGEETEGDDDHVE